LDYVSSKDLLPALLLSNDSATDQIMRQASGKDLTRINNGE